MFGRGNPSYMKFNSGVKTYEIYRKFNEKKYFSDYDYFERYVENKHYPVGVFTQDLGHGSRQYRLKVFNILLYDVYPFIVVADLVYVAVVEELTDDTRAELAPYCQCKRCKTLNINPLKNLYSNDGCLKNIEKAYTQAVVKRTRKYMEKHHGSRKKLIGHYNTL